MKKVDSIQKRDMFVPTNFEHTMGVINRINKAIYGVEYKPKVCSAYKCGVIPEDEVVGVDEEGQVYCSEHTEKFSQ